MIRSRLMRGVAALVCASLALSPFSFPAASGLPDLGDVSQSLLSPAQERKVGEEIMRSEVRASGAYLDDPEVNGYLNSLGQKLVAASPDVPWDFQFFAVNDPAINAFALPGGFVAVNTGLILLVQSESELAAVLAHEISHVTQHHAVRMLAAQQKSSILTMAGMALAILAARSNPAVASAAIATAQASMLQFQLNFTRENEQEADRLGFQRLAAAGFDTTAQATFMERLQRATRVSDSNAPNYLRSHPITSDRIAEALDRSSGKPYVQVKDSLDFHFVRALVRSYQGTPREAVNYFEDALKEKKYNNEAATRYGLVASLLRARDFDRAQAELAKLEKMVPRHPMIEGVAGQILLQSKQYKAAIARYESALQAFPGHLQLIYDYPTALLEDHQPAAAARFVSEQIRRFPDEGALNSIAAKAYAELGKDMEEHRYLGEYYYWQGNIKGAVDQFEIASKAKDGDFYTSSAVEARLRTLRQEMRDRDKTLQAGKLSLQFSTSP
jgi:predicted Zn-dependent protease